MTIPHVSDDVWAELDPSLARLPRRTRIRVALWTALAAIVVAIVLLATASGLVVHRLSVRAIETLGDGPPCAQVVSVENDGWFDEQVAGQAVAANGTGAVFDQAPPSTIPSGGSAMFVLNYSAAYCRTYFDALRHGRGSTVPAADLIVRTKRPWGVVSQSLRVVAPSPDGDGFHVRW